MPKPNTQDYGNRYYVHRDLHKEILNKYLARDFGKISIEGKFGA
ncbi:MAG: hypothetical protein S4CHLAM81_01570 [Chlamydiales bacterium]|nr:hypothetical protein [Chlamydiales bacterium]MCH9634953.1 hypothetical protein [Chlamydiales bacterium]